MSIEDNAFGPPHRVVELALWHEAVAALKADGYTYFDWMSAVDEHPDGFRVVLHVAKLEPLHHLLLVTYVERETPAIASISDVYAGAGWHERETHEMFGIDFFSSDSDDVVELEPLLLPDGFEGHPLRKEFVLASRVAKPWPGGKEPGESDADSTHSPSRRRVKPPGVPDDWLQAVPASPVEPTLPVELVETTDAGFEAPLRSAPQPAGETTDAGFEAPLRSAPQPAGETTEAGDE